jgi:hypothetical protein
MSLTDQMHWSVSIISIFTLYTQFMHDYWNAFYDGSPNKMNSLW